MISVILLTGFLGSGKTTLLNRLLAAPAMAGSAVVVNELGEIGVDHDLILEGADDAFVLSGGCLCCSMGGDAVEALARLLNAAPRPIRRVLLETSGGADPVPILAALAAAPQLAGRFATRRVVTVVDAALGAAALAAHEEARRQLAVADTVVLSKTDIAEAAAGAAARRLVGEINPGAPVHIAARGDVPEKLLRELADAADWAVTSRRPESLGGAAARASGHVHGSGFVTASVRFAGAVPQDAVEHWLDELLSCFGAQVLRVKGILRVSGIDDPVALHAVQHIVSAPERLPAWPSADRDSRLVVIAQDLDASLLQESLEWLAAQAAAGGGEER